MIGTKGPVSCRRLAAASYGVFLVLFLYLSRLKVIQSNAKCGYQTRN